MALSMMRLLGLLGAMAAFSSAPVAAQLSLPLPIPIVGGTLNCILCQAQAEAALVALATGLPQGLVNGALEPACQDPTIVALGIQAQCISFADTLGGLLVNYVENQLSPQALCQLVSQC
ncbi:hypothetical protein BD289DRAFT_84474 [Coniella lustricola]|uniref:Saposin B-type domain-containing protein n=1 Tax=Coniella lustricola TaxID=2025994 RepID=A0A2T3AHE7_9PEZI|nr:hypothetical protein BD289DRAFT_84474 [Coniella lustricola]